MARSLNSCKSVLKKQLSYKSCDYNMSKNDLPKANCRVHWNVIIIFNIFQVNQNTEALKKNFLELTELKHILRKTQQFFDEQDQLDVQGHYAANQQLIPEESVYSASRWNKTNENIFWGKKLLGLLPFLNILFKMIFKNLRNINYLKDSDFVQQNEDLSAEELITK